MTKSKSTRNESRLQMPAELSEEDRGHLVKKLRRDTRPLELTPAQERELFLFVEHYLQDIQAWRAEIQRIRPRSERSNRLRRIEKALRRVQYEVESCGEMLDDILPFDLSERLGGKLTFAALSAAIDPASKLRLPTKALAARKGPIDIVLLELEFDYKRRALGLKYSGRIFKSMIDDLCLPLSGWVERDKKAAGQKPMVFRNMLIERLIEASPLILGKRATSTANGRFVRLCTAVLPAVGLPSEGLEKAVAAVLKQVRAR